MSLFIPPTATNLAEWVRKVATAINEIVASSNTASGSVTTSRAALAWLVQ